VTKKMTKTPLSKELLDKEHEVWLQQQAGASADVVAEIRRTTRRRELIQLVAALMSNPTAFAQIGTGYTALVDTAEQYLKEIDERFKNQSN
jgi:hypothetical protein